MKKKLHKYLDFGSVILKECTDIMLSNLTKFVLMQGSTRHIPCLMPGITHHSMFGCIFSRSQL